MKPAFNNVILDLDGTLTDSAEGVYNAIGYALKEIGREVPRSQLRFMLGPPSSRASRSFSAVTGPWP